MENLEIQKVIRNLALEVFGDDNFEIEDFDFDRVYISRDNEEYDIRTWDISSKEIRWTLFKMINHSDGSGHGEEQKEGLFKIK